MERMIVISDIHGMYRMLLRLLEKVNYDLKKDKLIILGDLVDRGPESKEVIEFFIGLENKGANLILLKGNHDDMFIRSLYDYSNITLWCINGGIKTLESYYDGSLMREGIEVAINEIKDKYNKHIEFLENSKLYYETDNYIFVHAGIDPTLDDWKETEEYDFMWIREEFIYTLEPLKIDNKKVIFGHTPAKYIHKGSDIWFSPCGQKIGIDGGAAYGMQLNALIIENNKLSTESVKYEDISKLVNK